MPPFDLVIRAGVVLTVGALGLRASARDATFLVRHPDKLARAVFSMNIVMPALVFVMVWALALRPVIELVLVTLALSPIPPFLPSKALRAGGDSRYAIGLLCTASVLAIAFVPLAAELFSLHVRVTRVAEVMVLTVLAPLAAGMIVHRLAPRFAMRSARWVSIAGMVVLLGGALPVIVVMLPKAFSLIGDGTLAALVVFVAVGLFVGHVLGGPEPGERKVLALTTSSRHPGVALAIASGAMSDKKTVLAALVLYLLVATVVTIPYLRLGAKRSKVSASASEGSGHRRGSGPFPAYPDRQ